MLQQFVQALSKLRSGLLRRDGGMDYQSLVLAGLSLSITLFALPSFWADLAQLSPGATGQPVQRGIIPWIGIIGDILAPLLIFGSLAIALMATYRFMSFRTRQQHMLRLRRRKRLSNEGL